jgi:uncharacterized SAM-binding protein YcdF (DUF218 family)
MSMMKSMEGDQANHRGLDVLRHQGTRAPRRLPRLVRWTFSLCLFAIFMVGIGFLAFATHVGTLETPENPRKADAIIVLTGGLYRLDAGVNLLDAGKGERLLISGVNPKAGRDDLRVATGGDRKLFSCCVDIDHAALDTIGNAEESGKWMEARHYNSVILVTNNYHMPRSLLEMRRFLRGVEIQPYPVVNTTLSEGSWFTDKDALRVIATEYVKFVAAFVRGWPGNAEGSGAVTIKR